MNQPEVRIEFERSISKVSPPDLLKQKLIMNDMGFYQRVLSKKIEESIGAQVLGDKDVLIIRYDLEGNRQIDVTQISGNIAAAVQSLAQGIFPLNYKNAKQ